MAFKMRSGYNPAFKMMGSSPMKQLIPVTKNNAVRNDSSKANTPKEEPTGVFPDSIPGGHAVIEKTGKRKWIYPKKKLNLKKV